MKMGTYLVIFLMLTGCVESTSDSVTASESLTAETSIVESEEIVKPVRRSKNLHLEKDFEMVSLNEIDIPPPPEDSISYHICYEVEPNLILAVAQPNQDTFEGVRLQLIKKKKNGKLKLLDESSPGYDSPQLFPTFFKNEFGEFIIIANMGMNDSWGAKVYSVVDEQFSDMGYVDMAIIERREFPDDEGKMTKYANISKSTEIKSVNDVLVFSFTGEHLLLFEDNNEQREVKFSTGEYDYLYDNKSWILRKN